MSHEDDLKQAVALIKSGDKEGGAKILKTILKADRNHERAWLWMSACVETNDDRIYCLQEVLRINPQNESAQKALDKLRLADPAAPARPVASTAVISQPLPSNPPPKPAEVMPAAAVQPPAGQAPAADAPQPVASPVTASPTPRPTGMSKTTKIVLLVFGILVGLCMICGGVVWYITDQASKSLENISNAADENFEVEYILTGNVRNVSANYLNGSIEEEDLLLKSLPWSKKMTMPGASMAVITATNPATGGTLTCEIKVNGKSVSKDSTAEANGIAECAAMVGVSFP